MNADRQDRLENELNGLARKVLNAVPLSEPWTTSKIAGEMRRQGLGVQFNVLEGALNGLRGRGLIKEPQRGEFIRCERRTHDLEPCKEAPMKPTLVKPIDAEPEPKKDSLTRLADLAASLRTTAEMHRALAEEAESIGLDFEERIQQMRQGDNELQQLKMLLRGIVK